MTPGRKGRTPEPCRDRKMYIGRKLAGDNLCLSPAIKMPKFTKAGSSIIIKA